ncbi:alpha-acetolactate decarboxylase [Sphingobacterium alimentarium]|uniref:Alpha-acetolactate decarboxylase n=1 Tax=Sphingobacterium alimentarium TaxID=797292 RepID=A0A4R3VYZ8_9SPHI|nr:acetolactate decarboxylase [Sphingobacterium alimentarium]TCV19544.1 alpha-acetolactate decarboxylase [Sphingobacterium alimentarium]
MKVRNILTTVFICIGLSSFSQQIINGFAMPESVTSDGKRFFVSNQGQDVFSKDGDGFISEISEDGKQIELKFLPLKGVLNAPKGMTVVNNILYVADLDRVIGFNINTRKTVFEITIPEAKVLNDICRLENGFIAVTETVSGNIYKINTKNKSFEIIGNIPTANGINYNEKTKQLVVCTNGKNYGEGSVYIKTGNEDFKELPNIANGFFDGIEWIDDNHLLISDWVTFPVKDFGKLWIYNLSEQISQAYFTGESIADIYYNPTTQKIYMPQMFHNKVIIAGKNEITATAQTKHNVLYNYGIIDAFIGGLYKGSLPIKDLKLKGDFGIGAPDMLNGELTMLNGKAYQTKATGETVVLDNDHKTSFSTVTFFRADTVFYVNNATEQKDLLEIIANRLTNKNAMYAIKITGDFSNVRTRAFPPVKEEPFPVLSTILDRQQFFDIQNTAGTLVGYHLPEYLNGIQMSGFHLHFLSANTKQGGHVLGFKGQNLKIEIAELKSFELEAPTTKDFQNFQFRKKHNEDLERVEQGK